MILEICTREEFRKWLTDNHNTSSECYIKVKRGRPTDNNHFWYIDAVEEALCFGWIDSTVRNGLQRFTPRRGKSNWTELNKARCKRLIDMKLMTEAGMEKFLKTKEFVMDSQIEKELKDAGAWEKFIEFPELYRKIRISNIVSYRNKSENIYKKRLDKLISETIIGNMYGEWNDYGRLK